MTNVEVMQQQARQLLEDGRLSGRSRDFVSTIIRYKKNRLRGLSPKQYHWLRDIIRNTE